VVIFQGRYFAVYVDWPALWDAGRASNVRGEAYVVLVGVGDALEEVDVFHFGPPGEAGLEYWVGDIIAEGDGFAVG